MPELPEVESIKNQLEKLLKGHEIVSVEVLRRKNFQGDEKKLWGLKILGSRRLGKVIVINLSNNYSILTHVKMTGQYIYEGPNLKKPHKLSKKVIGGVPGKHTLVVFRLDKGGILYYNDVRRFGWIKLVKTSKVGEESFIKKLGPEPLKDLTLDKFMNILSKTKKPIKVVLMDQGKMGGVGNIYANDALWLARVNPKKKADSLKMKEIKDLYEAILSVLKKGIKYGGASEIAFVTPDGSEGKYQAHTLAYGRQGEPCERCHIATFKKFFLGGRGTYWCPVCQK
ncbi:bifunctional DNA-formamidopyrimidine glycosylase/DNA-(apurinic or apyrimidinic site) lyase [Patescibacteria group bacterium]